MNLLKIVLLVLGLAVVAFTAKVALTGTIGSTDPPAATGPKRQFDNVRQRATELGNELQKAADRADVER